MTTLESPFFIAGPGPVGVGRRRRCGWVRFFIVAVARSVLAALGAACLAGIAARAAEPAVASAGADMPTSSDVRYGQHPEDVFDFWRASGTAPTPVVLYFHGSGGDKAGMRGQPMVRDCLAAGVSFAAVNYRDVLAGATFHDVLRECARALQFLRANAAAWNIDPARVAVCGDSFGATTSLWLAFHDDLADPDSPDPVLRQSSRPACAGSNSGQVSFDPERWVEVFGKEIVDRFFDSYKNGAYKNPRLWGLTTEKELRGPEGQKRRADCDVVSLISKDDPPVFLSARRPDALTNANEFVHHPKLSRAIYDRCRAVGAPVIAEIPALGIHPSAGDPPTWRDLMFRVLKVTPPGERASVIP